MVGSGSVVTRDVADYELVAGNPARRLGSACPCGQPLRDVDGEPFAGDARAAASAAPRGVVRVLTVVGARPQFVKAAPVSRVLAAAGHEEMLIHTGQHYDDAMSAAFFRDLEMAEPALNLEVGSGSHGAMTGEMMRRLEPVILERRAGRRPRLRRHELDPRRGASWPRKVSYDDGRRPWLAHVEAGLRSFNRRMPEERNRIVADHLADLLLAPTRRRWPTSATRASPSARSWSAT